MNLLSQKPKIMGVLNLTPDSFSDGGKFNNTDKALIRAAEIINEGADIIDLGAESTRPGAIKISVQEELDRLLPVLEKISQEFNIIISVDTYNSKTMEESLKRKAQIINDISGLSDPKSFAIIAKYQAKICIMHMQGLPPTMQKNPVYHDIITEVYNFFEEKIASCLKYNIKKEQIILDPGFGFGKTLQNNIDLLKNLKTFSTLNCPILVGVSRKSMIEKALGPIPIDKRLPASLTLAIAAVQNGANIIRSHDVYATKQAIDMLLAIN